MWRKNKLSDNIDSDQSISEEEENLETDWSENCISLGGHMDNKRQVGICVDDEVEDPVFNDEDDSIHHPRISACYSNKGTAYLPTVASISNSDEEITSDDEKVRHHTLRSIKKDVGCTWSEASREAEALVCLYENSSCSSSGGAFVKENKSSKGGGRDKAKPTFSFGFQSRKEDLPLVVSHKNVNETSLDYIPLPDQLDAAADRDMNKSIADTRWVFHGKETEQTENHTVPSELALDRVFKEHSMAEFLDCFKERSGLQQGSSEMENPQSVKSIIPSRTMVDQFQEAFGTVPLNDERPHLALPRPLGGGLFGRLQQVIQSEKERDSRYLKNLCAEDSAKDERDSIAVRILSRSLEAKLTVCSCTFVGDGESSYWEKNLQIKMESGGRTLTIIFNSRICSDVDLEVGNLVRIHPPWKKVQMKEMGEVILCTYFSQIQL